MAEKKKERGLVLPKNFVDSYLDDLDAQEQSEIIKVIFHWYRSGEILEIKHKMVRVLFHNLLYFLETSKINYENGAQGGAPQGNKNASKQHKTTPLELENNPPCFKIQPPLKKNSTLKEEKRKEEKRKELEENRNEKNKMQIEEIDMFSKEALELAEETLNKILKIQ